MKRVDGLYDLSRRQFCAVAGAAGIGAVLVACGSDDSSSIDGSVAGADAPAGGACTTGATDVGAPGAFALNAPVFVSSGKFFVVRDSGGLYALTALCTHEGAATCIGTSSACSSTGTQLFCPRHGAVFKFDGTVVRGPASTPLGHFAMCLLPNGHVGVTTSMRVAATTRLVA